MDTPDSKPFQWSWEPDRRPPVVEIPFGFVPPAIVAIGASTGGPTALEQLLPALPEDLPVGVLVVQHMPLGFTGPFTERMNALSKVEVVQAQEGMPVERGRVYIAVAGQHMTVRRRSGNDVTLNLSPTPTHIHTPSVDVMMASVAEAYHARAMGIIMTGMGNDGALGMRAIHREGGLTVGQSETSCAVYGMPRCCAEMGILTRVVPLAAILDEILTAVHYYKPQ